MSKGLPITIHPSPTTARAYALQAKENQDLKAQVKQFEALGCADLRKAATVALQPSSGRRHLEDVARRVLALSSPERPAWPPLLKVNAR